MTLVAQFSDIHARAGGASVEALRRAVDYVAPLKPEAAIVSGDLAYWSDGEDPEGYTIVRETLARLGARTLLVPGNADRREPMRRAFADLDLWPAHGPLNFCERAGELTLIGLDVTVPGESFGDATAETAAWLNGELERADGPVLLAMHQHPFRTELPLIDRNMCRNPERIEEAVRASGKVVAVICGHGHRAVRTSFAGVPAMMCPSLTAANKLPFAGREQALALVPAGFMLHEFTATGLVSHTIMLGDGP